MAILNRLMGARQADWTVDPIIISPNPDEKAIQGIGSPKSHIHVPVSARVFLTVFFALPFVFWTFSQVSTGLKQAAAQNASETHSAVISHVPSKSELARTHHDIPDFVSIPHSDI